MICSQDLYGTQFVTILFIYRSWKQVTQFGWVRISNIRHYSICSEYSHYSVGLEFRIFATIRSVANICHYSVGSEYSHYSVEFEFQIFATIRSVVGLSNPLVFHFRIFGSIFSEYSVIRRIWTCHGGGSINGRSYKFKIYLKKNNNHNGMYIHLICSQNLYGMQFVTILFIYRSWNRKNNARYRQ